MQENINIPDSEITTNLTFRQLVLMNMQQLTNFPYIEKDFDALTDYELLCLVVKFLNDVIANQNEQNASITRMYESFLALQEYVNNTKDTLEDAFNTLDDYVRNYFNNLDVQEEINNKLDEMVEDGTLFNIISNYLPINISVPSAINSSAITSSCLIINVDGKTIMYDVGDTTSYSNIVSELARLNITYLDVVIISHFDGDHAGNYRNIIDNYCDENTLFYIGIVPSDITDWNADLTLYNNFISYMNTIGYTYNIPNNNSSVSLFNCFDIRFFNTDINSITYYEDYTGEYSVEPTLNLLSLCVEINILNQLKVYCDGDAELPTQLLNIDYINPCDIYYGNHHATNLNGYYKYFDRLNPKIILLSLNQSTTTPASYLSKYLYYRNEIDVLSTQNQTLINIEVKNKSINIKSGYKFANNFYDANNLMSVDQVLPFYNDYTNIVIDNNTKATWTIKDIFTMMPYVKQDISFYIDSTRTALFNEIKSLFGDLLNYNPTQYFITLHSLYIEISPNTNWTNISLKILRGYVDKETSPNNVILSLGDKMQINPIQNLTENNQSITYRNELKALIQIKDTVNENVYDVDCRKLNYSDNKFTGSKTYFSSDETHLYETNISVEFTISNGVLNVTRYIRVTKTFINNALTNITSNTEFTPYRINFIL